MTNEEMEWNYEELIRNNPNNKHLKTNQMSNSFQEVLKQYEANKQNNQSGYPFYLTEAQFNIIRQLVRIQLSELIDNDANNKIIDHFTSLDVSLTAQYNNTMNIINDVDSDLPF
jgi:hypothetical protein